MQNNNKHTGFKGWMRDKGYYMSPCPLHRSSRDLGLSVFQPKRCAGRRRRAHRRPANAERPGAGGNRQRHRVFGAGCRTA